MNPKHATTKLENAIPKHLRLERLYDDKVPSNHVPIKEMFSMRFPEKVKDIVMLIVGSQHVSPDKAERKHALQTIHKFVKCENQLLAPEYWEAASVVDEQGAYNQIIISYWRAADLYKAWAEESGFSRWWGALNPEREAHGWFKELFLPTVDRFETLFINDQSLEGLSHMGSGMSGHIAQHGYWGAMRDRIPLSQVDDMAGSRTGFTRRNETLSSSKQRIQVTPRRNLAVIRSGQDWSLATPAEKKKYFGVIQPVLNVGMDYLRDNRHATGCLSCRYMDVLSHGDFAEKAEKTFGLAYFDDLASLEKWCSSHITHLAIFHSVETYGRQLAEVGIDFKLRFWHEVLVLEPEQQHFEYVCCHEDTGMLSAE